MAKKRLNVTPFRLHRRHVLKGSGTAMALPYLEAMMPSSAVASPKPEKKARMGVFYFGTGMNMRQFETDETGPDFKLTPTLKPFEPHRGHFTYLSNTYQEHGGAHDGEYCFTTAIAKGEPQSVSFDQIAAAQIGEDTRFPSMVMSVDDQQKLALNSKGVPLIPEDDPKVLFDRLFRPDPPEVVANRGTDFRQRKSVLDLVRDEAKWVDKRVGKTDREQLDQYFTSVRELEKSLAREIDWADKPKPVPHLDGYHDYTESMTPEGTGDFLYRDYGRMMYDLIALAFQTDSTRVVTYTVRHELKGGVFPEFGVSKGYHALSHHGNDPKNLQELAKVDLIYMQQWCDFLERLKSIPDGDGTLLDNVMLGFSSGFGMDHSRDRLPTVVCGGSGLGVKHQGHVRMSQPTTLSSVWHTMLDRCGVQVTEPFQDSLGPIQEIIA